jgi:hypothetical protein
MKNLKSKNVKLNVDEKRKIKGGKPYPAPACFMNYDMQPVMDCNQCAYYRNPCFPIW